MNTIPMKGRAPFSVVAALFVAFTLATQSTFGQKNAVPFPRDQIALQLGAMQMGYVTGGTNDPFFPTNPQEFANALVQGRIALARTNGWGTNNVAGANLASSNSAVGGGFQNTASGLYATVAGGAQNTASGFISAVGGGRDHTANGEYATVGGGRSNTASSWAVVSGGWLNSATGNLAAIGGGYFNNASGEYTTVPGGIRGKATNEGSFVWSSDWTEDTISFGNYTFTVRAEGGVRFYTANGTGTGVSVAAGTGSWTSLSDRDAKANFQKVNATEVLAKVAAMPVMTWNYKTQDESIRHIGPTAQDFRAAFGVGESDTGISTIDADGVALAAIKGLVEELKKRDQTIEELQSELRAIREQLSNLPPQ
jgi:hypothetical protein